MIQGRKQRLAAAAIVAALALVGAAAGGRSQPADGVAPATRSSGPAGAGQPSLYRPKAGAVLYGVLAPLDSLRVMQRAIALAPDVEVASIPTLALLAAPLKTTGLGPIRIGMELEDLPATGLVPVPIAEASSGECQYYRIQDHSEPITLMAIAGKVLRIDVGQGSLTTTRSGVGIGATEADLVRLYGQQLEAKSNPETLGKTVIFTPQDPGEDIYRLVFETDDRGQVIEFRAGQFPAVTWPEGCL